MYAEQENCILFGRSLPLTLLASIILCNINSSIGIDCAPLPLYPHTVFSTKTSYHTLHVVSHM